MPLLIRCSFRTLIFSFSKDNLFSASILLKSVNCLCNSSSAAIVIKNRVHEVFRSRMNVHIATKTESAQHSSLRKYRSVWCLHVHLEFRLLCAQALLPIMMKEGKEERGREYRWVQRGQGEMREGGKRGGEEQFRKTEIFISIQWWFGSCLMA